MNLVQYDLIWGKIKFCVNAGVIAALKQIKIWGINNIEEKLKFQNNFIGSQLKNLGIQLIDEKQRAPHFLGAILPTGTRHDLISKLAEKNIYVSERGGTLRITPHLWNSKKDFEKFISELAQLL